jgi:hypothetical protein
MRDLPTAGFPPGEGAACAVKGIAEESLHVVGLESTGTRLLDLTLIRSVCHRPIDLWSQGTFLNQAASDIADALVDDSL